MIRAGRIGLVFGSGLAALLCVALLLGGCPWTLQPPAEQEIPSLNRPPVANAGQDQTVSAGSLVVLDGSGSYDPDRDLLTYLWEQIDGPAVEILNPGSVIAAFVAPVTNERIVLRFRLTVADSEFDSSDIVVITVLPATVGNRPPRAEAGQDQVVRPGQPVMLDGSGSSDPDGDALTYKWTQILGPNVDLQNGNSAQASFTAPDVPVDARLVFRLTVSDGQYSAFDLVNVTVVLVPNRPPVADAGSDQTVDEGAAVTLDGSGSSDPDGDPLTYEWKQISGPAVTLQGADQAVCTFVAPMVDQDTELRFRLTVSDGTNSDSAEVTVLVRDVPPPANQPPVADAGEDITVVDSDDSGDEQVTLDGSGSQDPDGTIVSYVWTEGGQQIATGVTPTVTLPVGVHTITLTVTDDDGATDTDEVVVTVQAFVPGNRAPVADAGADQAVDEGATVTLDGSGSSDPDGDPLTYQWEQISGPAVTLQGADQAVCTFVAPQVDSDTELVFRLTVSDGSLSDSDEVTVLVRDVSAPANQPPLADAGEDITVVDSDDSGDEQVTLDGSGSQDPDGTIVSYVWTEGGQQIATGVTPTVTLAVGVHTITLTVTDDDGATDTDEVVVTVQAAPAPSKIVRVSVKADGSEATDAAWQGAPSLSSDGSRVAFATYASLVASDDNIWTDIYVRDFDSLQTLYVSTGDDGSVGNGPSWGPSISADGSRVVFVSWATNLVSDDGNGLPDVFLRDLSANRTIRVSVASDGTEANGASYDAKISANGNAIVFRSWASNLVPDDTNGVSDIFVRVLNDLDSGTTVRVSVADDGSEANGGSWAPSISADGRFVAFESVASNLVPNDTNDTQDIFVRDLTANRTYRVSVAADGTEANGPSWGAAISADGRFVAFWSLASNLVPDDNNDARDVFVYDMQTHQIVRVSVNASGIEGDDNSWAPAVSADGGIIAFYSDATNLVDGDANGVADVFVYDAATGTLTRISVAADGQEGNGPSKYPAVSGDGRFVAFWSEASNLVPNDTNGLADVFRVDLLGQ